MPSIKQKFAGFLRQISNPASGDGLENANQPKSPTSVDGSSGCFIQRYLNGESRMKQPDILFGRTGQDLPCLRLCPLQSSIIAVHTGPDGGLTTVNRGEKGHVTTKDPDVLFIDSEDESLTVPAPGVPSPPNAVGELVRIRAMGQTFFVRNQPPSPRAAVSTPVQVASPSSVSTVTGPSPPTDDNNDMSTVCDDSSLPVSSDQSSPSLSPSVTSPVALTTTAADVSTSLVTTCAEDKSDEYKDFLSKFGILSLPAHPSLDRQSVTQIDSPDDTTLISVDSISPSESVAVHASVHPAPNGLAESATAATVTVSEALPQVDEPSGTQEPEEEKEVVAGIVGWNRPSGMAFGAATSLYERHPVSGETAGNPLADAFAVVARTNNALLCLADGVNWGERAALAARSAIHGAMDYLNRALFASTPHGRQITTGDIFLTLLRSFHAAHSMILQEGGLLTTLTAAVVAQLDQSYPQNALYSGPRSNSAKFAVCVCNVGDSLAYVYSAKHGVREITHGSHDVNSMRDMRDALGALGPVDGQNPELNNLTCSITVIEEGDIVFLTSDGVSDNFDPVVGKFVVARKPDKIIPLPTKGAKPTVSKAPSRHLPTVEAFQRHELTMLRMEDILRNGTAPSGENGNHMKAQQLCEDLVDFATRLTMAKRRLLEDPELYVDENGKALDSEEQKIRRRKICERLALIPGKLDHATCVAYEARIQPVSENGQPFRESTI